MAMALVLLVGCVGAGGFESRLASHSGEVMYLHEARATERQPGTTVSLATFTVEQRLPPATTVQRTGGFVVPLLFVNVWRGEYRSTLGAAQISNDYVQFMKDSFAEELKRSAKFAFTDHDGDVQVDVKVTNIEMNAPIVESGNFLFLLIAFGHSRSVHAGPVEVVVSGEAVARKGGQEVLRKPILGGSRTGGLPRKNRTIEDLMADYTAAMIEGLSLAVKRFNDAIVAEVNSL